MINLGDMRALATRLRVEGGSAEDEDDLAAMLDAAADEIEVARANTPAQGPSMAERLTRYRSAAIVACMTSWTKTSRVGSFSTVAGEAENLAHAMLAAELEPST